MLCLHCLLHPPGPGRLVLSNVVLANFSISSPSRGPVLWPLNILQPGAQPGGEALRRLLLNDVKLIVQASSTVVEYARFFADKRVRVYTVSEEGGQLVQPG
jgi:hypothetical protein